MRTISLENVRFDLKVIRPAMNDAKLKEKYFFVTSQICGFYRLNGTFKWRRYIIL